MINPSTASVQPGCQSWWKSPAYCEENKAHGYSGTSQTESLGARSNPHGLAWEWDVALIMIIHSFNHKAFPLQQSETQGVIRKTGWLLCSADGKTDDVYVCLNYLPASGNSGKPEEELHRSSSLNSGTLGSRSHNPVSSKIASWA